MSVSPEPSMAIFAHTDPLQVAALLAERKPVLLLDVREQWEYIQGHLPGAQLLPLSGMPGALAALSAEPHQQIVTYCHNGIRSQKAAAMLVERGYLNVASMDGGIDAWATEVDASVGRY